MQLLARHAARAGSGQAVLRFRCPHCGAERGIVYVPLEPLHLNAAPAQSAAKAVHCPSCDGVFYRRELRQGQEIIMEAFANPSGWLPPEMIAPMPTPRQLAGAVIVDGKLWVLGGIGAALTNAVEVYDPAENTWTQMPALATNATGPAVFKSGKIFQYGINRVVIYEPYTQTSRSLTGVSGGTNTGRGAVDHSGSTLLLATSGHLYEMDADSEAITQLPSVSFSSSSIMSWSQEEGLYRVAAQRSIRTYDPNTQSWSETPVSIFDSNLVPGRSFNYKGELYGMQSSTSTRSPQSTVLKWIPGTTGWIKAASLTKGIDRPAILQIEQTDQFLVIDGMSEWPIQFYQATPSIKTSLPVTLRTNEVPEVLPVSFQSPVARLPVRTSVTTQASLASNFVVPESINSVLPALFDVGNINSNLPVTFEIIATNLPVNFSIPFGRLLQAFFSIDATQIGRRTLRSYLSVPGAPVKRLGVSFTTPRTVIVGGGAIKPGEIHAASINLAATEKDQWRGSITSYTPLKPGTIALRIANIEVLANIEQVQVALVSGQTTYIGQVRPSTAPSLNKVVTNDPPEDPVVALEATGGYVSPQQIFNLRKAAPRPTAREYFMQAGELARVVILIDPDVPGADMPLPYRDIWSGSGKTFQTALTEVFGFAKPRIYVDSIGRIRVSRRRRPREFGKFSESPQSRTIAGSLAPLPESVPTFYAGPASILLPMAGGSKATNLDILRKKHGSNYPDLEYYAEWWSSANKLAVPFQDKNTTPPRDGYMRINPVIFWVEKPERPNRPPLPRGAWHAAGIRFTVGSGVRKR